MIAWAAPPELAGCTGVTPRWSSVKKCRPASRNTGKPLVKTNHTSHASGIMITTALITMTDDATRSVAAVGPMRSAVTNHNSAR